MRFLTILLLSVAVLVTAGCGWHLRRRLGVNYPVGPIAWGERLGWQRLLILLENLQRHYGEERYRPCSLLRQRALLESSYES